MCALKGAFLFACTVRAKSACKYFTCLFHKVNVVFICEAWPGRGKGRGWLEGMRVTRSKMNE